MLAVQLLFLVTTISSTTLISDSAFGFSVEPDSGLTRGAFFGAKVMLVSDEVRDRSQARSRHWSHDRRGHSRCDRRDGWL